MDHLKIRKENYHDVNKLCSITLEGMILGGSRKCSRHLALSERIELGKHVGPRAHKKFGFPSCSDLATHGVLRRNLNKSVII